MKTVISDYDELIKKAAEQIKAVLGRKPGAVLALAAGRTTAGLYEELSKMCAAGEISFKDARLFAVTEYVDCQEEKSCRHELEQGFVKKTDIREENCVFLDRDNLEQYDALIAAAGGLDLALLGLGVNAHIGFNEPATQYDTLSHMQKLTDKSRRALAEEFAGAEGAPEYALTMGIKTIVSAREIIVLAFGDEKSEAVFNMLYARDDSVVPAAFLQIPSDVTAYIDGAAARKL